MILLLLCFLIFPANTAEPENGVVSESADGKLMVWNASESDLSSLDAFWESFAKSNDAKYWGQSATYPNYSDVNEFDTFLVQLDEGTCLMQFFHSRWRRANDVQRWHDTFNDYSGCPNVFD